MHHEPQRWKHDYDRDGFLVVENLLDAETLKQLRLGIEKITADPDALDPGLRRHVQLERDYVRSTPKYNDLTVQEVGNAVRNIMELPKFDPVFAELICFEPLLVVLEALFDSPEFHFHNYKCIIKAPKVSSAFRWHRDLPYLEHSTPNLITAMLCLDPMTRENGATVVLPGSHRIPHDQVTADDRDISETSLSPDARRVTVVCPAGSAVLFHVNLIHGGGPNRSEIPRRNVIGIWAGPETYPVTAARYVYQDLYPRSRNPARQRQVRMTFPRLFGQTTKKAAVSQQETSPQPAEA